MNRLLTSSICLVSMLAVTGCATKSQAPLSNAAARPSYSLRAVNSEMIVAVSPARQTLQIAGSAGLLIGSSISAVANARHRKAIHEVLDGYNAGQIFDERVGARLEAAYNGAIERVEPVRSTAGYQNEREAEQDRIRGLRRTGYDQVLDLQMTYGLFGMEGTLIAKLEGKLTALQKNRTLWSDAIVVSSASILASDKLSDPTKRMGPTFSSPRLSVDENAISQWTDDGGAELQSRFESAVDGSIAALLVQLGLAEEATGYYHLGKLAMNRKNFDMAGELYEKALALDAEHVEVRNGLGVNAFHRGDTEEALTWLTQLADDAPDFGPAHYNVAWIYCADGKNAEAARPYYERALALGMPKEKKIDEALGIE